MTPLETAKAIQSQYGAGLISLQQAGLEYMCIVEELLADFEEEKKKREALEHRVTELDEALQALVRRVARNELFG